MKIKLLSVVACGLALGLAAFSPNANKAAIVVHAEETYVTVHENPCENLGVGGTNYDAFNDLNDIDGVNWNLQGSAGYDKGWRVGGKNATDADIVLERTVKTTTAIARKVDRIQTTFGDNTASGDIQVTLSVYSVCTDGVLSGQIGSSLSAKGGSNSTLTFHRPSGDTWENAYYQFVFGISLPAQTTSNKVAKVTSFTFSQVAQGDTVVLDLDTLDLVVNEEATLTATSATGNVTWTSEPSDVVSVTPSGELNDVATLVGLKEGTATITATVGTATATCTVNVSALTNNFVRVTDTSSLSVGDKIVFVFEDSGVSASTLEASDQYIYCSDLLNGLVNDYLLLTIAEGYEEGTYALALEDGKYLRNNSSYFTFLINPTLSNQTSWTISVDGETGKATVTNCNSSRIILYRTAYEYVRCHGSVGEGYELPVIYKYSEPASEGATTYANTFLSSTGSVCASTANGAAGEAPEALATVWAELKTSYEALSEADRTTLTNALANETGTVLEQAAARYDYIIAKYTSLNNFMSRTTVSMTNLSLNIIDNSGVNYILIIATAIALLGGCALVIKLKKKHN